MPDEEKNVAELEKAAEETAAADAALEAKLEAAMAETFGTKPDTDDADTDTDDTDTDTDTDDTDKDTDDTDTDEKDKTDDATSEDEEKTEDKTLTLPASHIHTAVRLGISEDEVKELFDKNPEFTISALEKLHAGENGLSARYAQMGRAAVEKEIAERKTTTEDGKETSAKSFVDLKKLRAQFDDDDKEVATLIDGVISPLNDALVKLQAQVDQRVQPTDQTTYNQQEDRAIQSEINSFFDNDRLKEFREYYGTVKPGEDPRDALTRAQFNNRGDVCKQGNFIRIGADFSGEKLTVSDVLERAHLQLTEPMREEMIRGKISSKIKKRAKSLSVKAGLKKVPKTPSSAKDVATQLEAKTAARLKKVFG